MGLVLGAQTSSDIVFKSYVAGGMTVWLNQMWTLSGLSTRKLRLPGVFTTGESPRFVYKRTLLVQNTLGSQDYPVINTLGSLDSLVYYSPKIFLGNLF